MSDSFTLVLSEKAREDLEDIWDYLALDSIEAADQALDDIYTVCQTLSTMPSMGRSREDLLPGIRSFPTKRHIVYYRLHIQILEVVRILHTRRDADAHF